MFQYTPVLQWNVEREQKGVLSLGVLKLHISSRTKEPWMHLWYSIGLDLEDRKRRPIPRIPITPPGWSIYKLKKLPVRENFPSWKEKYKTSSVWRQDYPRNFILYLYCEVLIRKICMAQLSATQRFGIFMKASITFRTESAFQCHFRIYSHWAGYGLVLIQISTLDDSESVSDSSISCSGNKPRWIHVFSRSLEYLATWSNLVKFHLRFSSLSTSCIWSGAAKKNPIVYTGQFPRKEEAHSSSCWWRSRICTAFRTCQLSGSAAGGGREYIDIVQLEPSVSSAEETGANGRLASFSSNKDTIRM